MTVASMSREVQPVPAHLSFDVAALERFLASALSGHVAPVAVSKFTGGQSNPTYRLETARGPLVLRRKPPGKVLASAHAVDREARVMRALGRMGFPVPKVLAESDDARLLGSPFYVMEYLDGRIFWDPLLPDLSPEDRRAVYFELTDALAALHAIDVDAAGLADFGPHGNYYARQIERWTAQYRSVPDDPIPEMELLAESLAGNLPEDRHLSLVHGDYRLDNAVFDPKRPELLGIIDWELATLGDPIADLSYFLLAWEVPLGFSGKSLVGAELPELGIPDAAEIVGRYFARSQLPRPASFSFYHAYNLFRLAAILHGIAARARTGNASSDEASRIGGMVRPAAVIACRMAGLLQV